MKAAAWNITGREVLRPMARGDKKDYQAATFRLPPDVLDKLEIESTGTGVPKGAIVEQALRAWFNGNYENKSGGTSAVRT